MTYLVILEKISSKGGFNRNIHSFSRITLGRESSYIITHTNNLESQEPTNMDVSGLWEETGENPHRHQRRLHIKKPPHVIWTFLLWGIGVSKHHRELGELLLFQPCLCTFVHNLYREGSNKALKSTSPTFFAQLCATMQTEIWAQITLSNHWSTLYSGVLIAQPIFSSTISPDVQLSFCWLHPARHSLHLYSLLSLRVCIANIFLKSKQNSSSNYRYNLIYNILFNILLTEY